MKELNIQYNEKEYRIIIDKYKIVLSRNIETTLEFFNQFFKVINKESESEYGEEIYKTEILVNEVTIDHKRSLVIEVTPYSKMDDFLKATSRSISLKYLESSLSEIEFDDLYQTFQHLYDLISEEIVSERTLIDLGDVKINYNLTPMNSKLLFKLIEPKILKNDLFANDNDLTLQEKIRIYLTIIQRAAEGLQEIDFYILLSCYQLTDSIIKELEKMPNNVCLLVNAYEIEAKLKKEKVCIIDKESVDFMSEDDIYTKIMIKHASTNDIEEFMSTLDRIFATETNNLYTNNILKLL